MKKYVKPTLLKLTTDKNYSIALSNSWCYASESK